MTLDLSSVDLLTETVRTERLLLRPPVDADVESITRACQDPDNQRWLSALPSPYTREHAVTFVGEVAPGGRKEGREMICAVEAGGELVGMCGLHGLSTGRLGPEIGYWIGRPFWGSGYASEALEAALRYADREWRKKLVEAGHFADNPASGRVLVKAGFLYTGVVEELFSLARGEKAPSRRMLRLA